MHDVRGSEKLQTIVHDADTTGRDAFGTPQTPHPDSYGFTIQR